MARFDVYANPSVGERKSTPYFLDVQNDHIDGLETRVVIPLRREAQFGRRARGLHPVIAVEGDRVVLDTAAIGAVPAALLKRPVSQARGAREEVMDALDTLFGSY